MFFSLIAISLIVILLYIYLTWNYNYWKHRGVPGPKPTILVGSFAGSFRQKVNVLYEIDKIYR